MSFERLLFGTAGVPNNTVKKNNPVEGVQKIHELGLDCMQLRVRSWCKNERRSIFCIKKSII
jgi:endonuclease IV